MWLWTRSTFLTICPRCGLIKQILRPVASVARWDSETVRPSAAAAAVIPSNINSTYRNCPFSPRLAVTRFIHAGSAFSDSKQVAETNRSGNGDDDKPNPEKQSYWQRFKEMYKSYWYVLIPVHMVTSVGWMVILYYVVRSGFDIVPLLEKVGASERILHPFRTSQSKTATLAYLATAYGIYHLISPLRYAVTLGATTLSITYLKRWGYIKPAPSPKQIKQFIQENPRSQQIQRMVTKRLKKDDPFCPPKGSNGLPRKKTKERREERDDDK